MDSKWAVHKLHTFDESTSRFIQFLLISVFIWAIFSSFPAALPLPSFRSILFLCCFIWNSFAIDGYSPPLPEVILFQILQKIIALLISKSRPLFFTVIKCEKDSISFHFSSSSIFFLVVFSLRLTFLLGYCNNCILLACVYTFHRR